MGQLFSSTNRQSLSNSKTTMFNGDPGVTSNEYFNRSQKEYERLEKARKTREEAKQVIQKEQGQSSKLEQPKYTQYSSHHNYISSSSSVVSSYNTESSTRTYQHTSHEMARKAVEDYKIRKSNETSSYSSSTQPTKTTSYSYVSPQQHAVYSSNSSAIPIIKHDTSKNIMPMFDSIYKPNAIGDFNKEYKVGSEVSVDDGMEASHSVQRKMYGYYECDCGAWWESAHSWANETQDCKGCGNKVFPYDQEDLKPRKPIELDETGLNKPHREDLCGMCKKLGMSCTIFMEIAKPSINKPKSSYYANQKPDVRVKGLPNDITEEKIRKMFASYGDISRVHILKQDPRFSTRVAFITFDDPEAVVDQFNSVKQAPPKAHRRRLLT